jgi:NADPH2:quinone reductase
MERSSVVVTDLSGPENLAIHTDEVPAAGSSEVVIKTQYCALNYPDLLMTTGDYQLHPNVPFTLGCEALGTVIECGSEVTAVKVGDVVHALTWHGAFTTHLVVDAGHFSPREYAMREVEAAVSPATLLRAPLSVVPNDLPGDKVAAMGFVYSTAYYALKDRGNLSKGQRVLILGASGGVGLAAVQVATACGAEVVAATRGDGHLLCRRFGATTIESASLLNDEQRRAEFRDNNRFDVVLDLLGGKYTEPALKTLRPEGRLLVIGFVSEEEKGSSTVHTGLVLVKECTLIGATWGAWASRNPSLHAANLAVLYGWLRDGTIDPFISNVVPLTGAAQALSMMQSGDVRGKILLKA